MSAAAWAAQYVGIPWLEHGRSRSGLDCWGLVCLVERDQYGIDLPSGADRYESTRDTSNASIFSAEWPLPGWREVQAAQPGDVLFFSSPALGAHVGVYVGDGMFLHVASGVDACLDRLASPMWARRLSGVYRHERHAA